MAYVKTHDGQVQAFPYTIGDLRKDNPNTSFPRRIADDILASYGVFEVQVDTAPAVDEKNYRAVRADTPTYVNDAWRLEWSVVEKTAEEKQQYYDGAASRVRGKRDNLLSQSDWRVIKAQETGTPMSQAWVDYRQALRDITSHANFPWLDDADWPVKPE